MELNWTPAPERKYRNWKNIISQLQSRPGQWALIGNMNHSIAYRYAKENNLEVRIANQTGSKADIYLRALES